MKKIIYSPTLGLPYMGSKRKLASGLLHFITERHKSITDFYDLFGGGGAVSFTAIRDYRFNVHYNELNSHIFSLVEYLCKNKNLDPKFYEWVTREEFFKQCARKDADWLSGFVMSCWSFGNKQNAYMYGADIEELKRLAHEFIVYGCLNSMRKLEIDIPELLNIKEIQKRRLFFCGYFKKIIKERFDMQNLERLQNLEHSMKTIQNLKHTNKSYENVVITGNNPVIYCDIPYRGTAEYRDGGFNYEQFYEWASDISHPVYISEYNSPLYEVMAFKHSSTLSATIKKQTIEKLFWNGRGIINETTLF